MNEYIIKFEKAIEKLAYTQTMRDAFYDVLQIIAVTLSNRVDKMHFDEREKQYFDVIQKYSPEMLQVISEAFSLLVLSIDKEYKTETLTDLLGNLFMKWNCGGKGQFFTPQHICTMMGKLLVFEQIPGIKEKGYISLCEPCCGAGAITLGFAQAMKDCAHNFQKELVVMATDVDIRCVHMTYIQLALYGIPAVVIHGDTLQLLEWSHWYTPAYVRDGWSGKLDTDPAPRVCSD